MSYTARIDRPAYQSLNPNLIYQDPYTSVQGNPGLVPAKSHGLEITGKQGSTTLKAGYTFTFDPFGGGALRGDTPRSYVLKRLNHSERSKWYASLSHAFDNGWWSSNNTASLTYTRILAFEVTFAPVSPRPQHYLFSDNRFRFGELFNLEVLVWYAGQLREGVFVRSDYGNVTLAVDRSFADRKWKARLIANDIFNTVRASGDYAIGETDIYFDNKWRSSYLRLAVTYDFGLVKRARYNNRDTGGSESGRVR